MALELHEGDLPDGLDLAAIARDRAIAVDTETMGLKMVRDRLCLVQLSVGDGNCHMVQIAQGQTYAPNLERLLTDPELTKIFHFARFDLGILKTTFGSTVGPVYCTKIASRLVRTFTDRHGLKDLCRDLLGVEISKQQQTSDWGAAELTPEQLKYAAADVLYLHDLRDKLEAMLERENRRDYAQACFRFLPIRADLDRLGWDEDDIFAH